MTVDPPYDCLDLINVVLGDPPPTLLLWLLYFPKADTWVTYGELIQEYLFPFCHSPILTVPSLRI